MFQELVIHSMVFMLYQFSPLMSPETCGSINSTSCADMAHQSCCPPLFRSNKIGADALVSKALSVRRTKAGSLLKTIWEVSALKLEEIVGHGIILLALNLTFLLIRTLTQNNLGPFQ